MRNGGMRFAVWLAYALLLPGALRAENPGDAAGGMPVPASEILTPPSPPEPRIHGPTVFGVRPGSPFLYAIPATGERPLRYAADGLPPGLVLDAATGRITGSLAQAGTRDVVLHAANARGDASRKFRIVVGEEIALTPTLGWNSWNCWGKNVDQEKVLAAARALVSTGLSRHGWTYVNVDDTWQGARGGSFQAIQPNGKFPDMQKLCDEIHALGLKAGIYSSPWATSYAGCVSGTADTPDGAWTLPPYFAPVPPGGARPPGNNETRGRHIGPVSFAARDARQWAAWGIDYLKYDWNPNGLPETREMADALRASGRDIVYSLSNALPFDRAAALTPLAQCWRTTGDIHDTWASMSGRGFGQDKWRPYAAPGHRNDPDMLVVGLCFGWKGPPRPTRLTADEQYTHLSLWCLLGAPLLIGCDLDKLDPFTLGLLTNDEVLDVDQDSLGGQAVAVAGEGDGVVYAKKLADGTLAVGLFNRGESPATVTAAWAALGLAGSQPVRDLWRQKDAGSFEGKYEQAVPPHGVALLRIGKPLSE